MHPGAFRKQMIEAYLAGAKVMGCGCYDLPTKEEARQWFDDEYGTEESEECDCCDED
jgi:hypothetical protein